MGIGFESPLGVHKESIRRVCRRLRALPYVTLPYGSMDDTPVGTFAKVTVFDFAGFDRLDACVKTGSRIVTHDDVELIVSNHSYDGVQSGDYAFFAYEGRVQLQRLVDEQREDGLYEVWNLIREL